MAYASRLTRRGSFPYGVQYWTKIVTVYDSFRYHKVKWSYIVVIKYYISQEKQPCPPGEAIFFLFCEHRFSSVDFFMMDLPF